MTKLDLRLGLGHWGLGHHLAVGCVGWRHGPGVEHREGVGVVQLVQLNCSPGQDKARL